MKKRYTEARLKRDLAGLFRNMDFVSTHPALNRDGPEAERFAEIYQQLGLAWAFLGCDAGIAAAGERIGRESFFCKTCGLARGVMEESLLLPREGKKKIGRRAIPNSKRRQPSGLRAMAAEPMHRHTIAISAVASPGDATRGSNATDFLLELQ